MKKNLIGVLSLIVLLILGTSTGASALSIALIDSTMDVPIIIHDGDDGDIDGQITFNGAVGSWTSNVTTIMSHPILGNDNEAQLDLNSVNVSGGSGWLYMIATDKYQLSGDINDPYLMTNSIGGTTEGAISSVGYIDPTYDLSFDPLSVGVGAWGAVANFGGTAFTTTMLNGTPFSDSANAQILPIPGLDFSLSEAILLQHSAAGQISSFNKSLTVIPNPEPATMLLFGSGLIGLAGFGRRKFKKS